MNNASLIFYRSIFGLILVFILSLLILLGFSYFGLLILAAILIVTLPETLSFITNRLFSRNIEIPGTMVQTMKDENVKIEMVAKKPY
ncbi:MAG: hypothetical protein GPJ54_03455 [Candidatus Heimdallarchaeota archaeon]|nr:hypothetical protein [Candidatus Heimdallarchaeota archaeon]